MLGRRTVALAAGRQPARALATVTAGAKAAPGLLAR